MHFSCCTAAYGGYNAMSAAGSSQQYGVTSTSALAAQNPTAAATAAVGSTGEFGSFTQPYG